MKGLRVWLDGIAFVFPAIQAAFQEFDPREMHGECLVQDDSAGFLTRTGAIDDHVFLLWDQRRVVLHFLGRDPPWRQG